MKKKESFNPRVNQNCWVSEIFPSVFGKLFNSESWKSRSWWAGGLRKRQGSCVRTIQVMLPLLMVSGAKPGPQLSDILISQVMPEAINFNFLFIWRGGILWTEDNVRESGLSSLCGIRLKSPESKCLCQLNPLLAQTMGCFEMKSPNLIQLRV